MAAGASGVLFGCDGVGGKETVVLFVDCELATRLFQIGSQIPRITMLPARRTPRKTTTRIIARRDMRPLQMMQRGAVKTDCDVAMDKTIASARYFCP